MTDENLLPDQPDPADINKLLFDPSAVKDFGKRTPDSIWREFTGPHVTAGDQMVRLPPNVDPQMLEFDPKVYNPDFFDPNGLRDIKGNVSDIAGLAPAPQTKPPLLVDEMRQAGFNDDTIGAWADQQRPAMRNAGFDDDTINKYFTGMGMPGRVPPSLISRLATGARAAAPRIGSAIAEGAAAGFGEAPLIGTEFAERTRELEEAPGPLQPVRRSLRLVNEAVTAPAMNAADVMFRGVNAALSGAGAGIGQAISEATGAKEGEAAKARRDWSEFVTFGALVLGSEVPMSRAPHAPGLPDETVGRLPQPRDFTDAARVIANGDVPPVVREKIIRLYEDHGVHPAEVAADAQRDPTIKSAFLSGDPAELPKAYVPEPATLRAMTPEEEAAPPLMPTEERPALATAGGVEAIDPASIQVDASRFQFKAGADEAGVSERLQGVTKWDPRLAGMSLVWRDEQGTNWIADGHQRLGLAKRLTEEGQQGITLNAFVLDAKEGITDADARIIAAAKNIAEGTGTAIDAAKIIRDAEAKGIEVPALPPRSVLVKDGQALARLSPDAFGMAVNEVVPVNQAAIVGRLVTDPGQQLEAIRLLAKAAPENARQAELIVRDMLASGTETMTVQGGLFGPEIFASSVVLERAKIADEALKQIKRDKATFASLVGEAERIEDVGANILDIESNRLRLSGDEQASQFLTTLASRKGPVSDALTDIARRLKSGELTVADAGREFVQVVRGAIEEGLGERPAPRGAIPSPTGERAVPAKVGGLFEEARAKALAHFPSDELPELEGTPRSLGAAAAGDIQSQAPVAPPPAKIINGLRNAASAVTDIWHDIQMGLSPMTRGADYAMATAKDFANRLRLNRWEWSRVDSEIEKRFDHEQRKRMWDAADEESVALQLGESREHQGLVTLTKEERAAIEELQARAQTAFVTARDLGMIEGEGLPSYTPRMLINMSKHVSGNAPRALNSLGTNLSTTTGNLKHRKHLTFEETEAAAKAKFGEETQIARDIRTLPLATAKVEDAIAGRQLINDIKASGKLAGDERVSEGSKPGPGWFTIDHPAFQTWRPKLEPKPEGELGPRGGKFDTVKDVDGNLIFERIPIYVHGDYEGPLRSVLIERKGAQTYTDAFYGSMMELKGKTMLLIMNSPLIHLGVEYGRAFFAMPGKMTTLRVFRDGNIVLKGDQATMKEAILHGMDPIGRRFSRQDITSVMEAPDLKPGRSWTSQVLAAIPDLFDVRAGDAVRRAVDKAGDFWHNKLLWEQVGKLQAGLYVNFRDAMTAEGVHPTVARYTAAHMANRFAGALPREAMSEGARRWANMLLFSRSFTFGNIGVIKDAAKGLPGDVLAQIERDVGPLDSKARNFARNMTMRRSAAIVATDIAALYVANSIIQSAVNVLTGERGAEEEGAAYWGRLKKLLANDQERPIDMLTPMSLGSAAIGGAMGFAHGGPLGMLGGAVAGAVAGTGISQLRQLSSTMENEPGKQSRIRIGYTAEGTARYGRFVFGKIGEEFESFLMSPMQILKAKEGTIAKPIFQVLSNDIGFGRKVYDPSADTVTKSVTNIGNIAKLFIAAQLPSNQLSALSDLYKGEGDTKTNLLQAFGPVAGMTFSKGAPGGPQVGEFYAAREAHKFEVDQALPEIRRQIARGDAIGAVRHMTELKMDRSFQQWVIRTTLNPSTRLSSRGLKEFYQYATPEQRDRFENAARAQR